MYHRIYFCLTYDLILSGRGPDIDNPSNLNINDVLGDYSLTLIDSLDTLAIMGNVTEFKKAVKLVVDNVSFDKPYTVQVSDSYDLSVTFYEDKLFFDAQEYPSQNHLCFPFTGI